MLPVLRGDCSLYPISYSVRRDIVQCRANRIRWSPSEGGRGGRRGPAEGRVEDLVAGPEADEHLPQAAMLPTESIQHTVLVADFQKKTNPPNFLQHFSISSALS